MPDMIGADTSIYRLPQQPNMLEQATQWGNLANSALANKTGQFDLAQKQIGAMYSRLGALYAKKDLTTQDLINEGSAMMAQGLITPQHFSTFMGNVDPKNPRAAVQNALVNTLDAQQRLNAVNGLVPVETGAGTVFMNRNQLDNNRLTQASGTSYIPNKLAPAQKATPTATFRNGQPGTVPLGSLVDDYGNARAGGVPLPAAPQPGAGAGANMAPGGFPNPAPQRGPVAQATVPFNPTGPGVGQAEAANRSAATSAEQGARLEVSADGTQNRKGILNNMEDALTKFESGPLAEAIKQGKATANQIGGYVNWQPFSKETVAAQEEFGKQAQSLINEQFKALGGTGTDNQLSATLRSNPNAAMSKYGIQQIIQMLKGNEDAIAAKNTAWQQWKQAKGPDTYGQFSQEFNKTFEPRVFQWVYMDQKQRAAMWEKMTTKNERAQFRAAYKIAEENGWLKGQ